MALTIDGSDPTGDLGDLLASKADKVGSVLQVVQGATTTETTVSSTSYSDTGLSVTITPSSATSKILILGQQQVTVERLGTNTRAFVQILRGATSINASEYALSINAAIGAGSNAAVSSLLSLVELDSPNTTSAITYKTQGRLNSTDNSANAIFQDAGGVSTSRSTLVAIEIGG